MSVAASRRTTSSSRAGPLLNPAESPLAWLRRRKDRDGVPMISQAQFDAGERLRADFWFAQMTPRVTMNWSSIAPQRRRRRSGLAYRADTDLADSVAAARERLNRTLAAVGPELAGILIDVCCHLKGLEEAERSAGWPQRSGKVILSLALTRLARHYGIAETTMQSATGRAPVRHWGSDDYRPPFELPSE